jgi:hypothetical protein
VQAQDFAASRFGDGWRAWSGHLSALQPCLRSQPEWDTLVFSSVTALNTGGEHAVVNDPAEADCPGAAVEVMPEAG